MTDEELLMSLAKIKFEKKWDSKTLSKELGSSYVWMLKVISGKAPISKEMQNKIMLILDRYECKPWKAAK